MMFVDPLGMVTPLLAILLLPLMSFVCCAVIANLLTKLRITPSNSTDNV
jgi:hypothetical protein